MSACVYVCEYVCMYVYTGLSIYVHFRGSESINEENFKSEVVYGEMATIPLEQLTTIVDKVQIILQIV